MKELLIQLALDGYRVTFTNAGFALKDSIEVRISKADMTQDPPVCHNHTKILNHRDFDHLENHLRDGREEINARIRGEFNHD